MKKHTITDNKKTQQKPQQKTDNQLRIDFNSTIVKILLIVVVTVIFYIPAIKGDFLWDDRNVIKDNLLLRSTDGLSKFWFAPGYNKYEIHYWPLVYSTFWVEYHIWGLHTSGYHIVNILLHSLNAVLLWLLLRRLLIPGAYFAAFLFAVHPVHVESVAWIVELKDVLSGMFYLLAFLAYVQFDASKKWLMYILALSLFICAMLSKTMAVTLPIALFLFIWWKKDSIKLKDVLLTIPFLFTGIFITLSDIAFTKTLGSFHLNLTIGERIIIAGRAVWFYLEKLFLPTHLVAIYYKWNINAQSAIQYIFPVSVIVVVMLLWLLRKRIGKGPLALVLYFIITLSPALGLRVFDFMKHSYVADRFQYLASIGIIILFSAIATNITKKLNKSSHQLSLYASIILIFILGIMTSLQCSIYKDVETLFNYNLKYNPNSTGVHNNIAVELSKKGKTKEAMEHYLAILKIDPNNSEANNNYAAILVQEGKINEAIPYYNKAMTLNPKNPEAQCNYGAVLVEQGNFEEGLKHLKKSIEIEPSKATFQYNYANGLATAGKYEEAIPHLLEALRIQPNYAEAYNNLGTAYIKTGRAEESINAYRTALQLDPKILQAARNLAWILATNPDAKLRNGEEAVQLAMRVNELTNGNFPEVLDTLAAAYAEAGRFDDAVLAAQKAFYLARQRGQMKFADELETHIQLFKEKKPFREK